MCLTWFIGITCPAAFAQQPRDEPWHGMPIDSKVMAAKRIRYVAPVYPDMARVARTEGDVVLHANIGTDGTVVGLQTISGNPLLVRAALEAAMKWQYEPMVINSRAVQVDTTLVIRFVLSEDQQTTSNAQTVPNHTGVIIRLRNGGTIHADTAHKIHGRVEYTIGEGTYRINESLVTEILEGKDAQAAAVSSATPSKSATSFDAPANKVTATPLKAMPKIPAEDAANWELYQSTEVLREEQRRNLKTGASGIPEHIEFSGEPGRGKPGMFGD